MPHGNDVPTSVLTSLNTAGRRTEQMLLTLRAINRLIAGEKNVCTLIRELCGAITDNLNYDSAWIAVLDQSGKLDCSAYSGFGEDTGDLDLFLKGDFPDCMRKAIDSHETVVTSSPVHECPGCPFSGRYGQGAIFTDKLSYNGMLFGVISVSVPLELGSSDAEITLFCELAGDIAFGLRSLRIEEKQKKAHEEKTGILESISDAFLALDRDLVITWFNGTAARLFGKEPQEVVGKNANDVFPEAEGSVFAEKYQEVRKTGKPIRFETWFPAEPYRNWYEIRLYPSDNGSVSVYCTVTTEIKHAELALRESQERLTLVLRGADLGTWDWDIAAGKVTYSDRWAGMLGYSLDEIDGTVLQWEKLVHPDDIVRVKETLRAHLAGETEYYQIEHRLRGKSGGWVWVLASGGVTERDADGNPIRVCGTHMDVSRRKTTEKNLFLNDLVLKQIEDRVIVTDLNGVITFVNDANCRMMGRTREELIGQHVSVLGEDPSSGVTQQKIIDETLKHGRWRGESTNYSSDGSAVILDSRISLVRDEKGNPLAICGVSTDITETRKTEGRVKLLSQMLDLAPASITIHDDSGDFHYANRETVRLHGYSNEEEFCSVNLHQLDVPESEGLLAERFRMIAEDSEALFEVEHFRKDGTSFPLEVQAKAIEWEGKPAVLSIAMDITERKLLQEKREEQQALLAAIYRNAPLVMMVLDRECRVEQVNGFASMLAKRPVEEMTGLRVGEALRCAHAMEDARGCGFGDLCGECVIRNKVLETIENGRTNLRIETQYDIKNGDHGSSQMNFLVSSTPISVGESPMALVSMMDITNRVMAEKALSESEERFRALVENSPYAILLMQEGRYTYCNPAGLELMGFSRPEEIVGADPLFPMAPEFRENIRERMKRTELGVVNEPVEIKFMHTDGSERWSLSSSVTVQMNGKPTAIIVGQDITEKKRMETENRRLEERFQKFQRLESIGRLAGGIAHDLNNLLTPILGYGEMLMESFSNGTAEKEQLSQMVSAGKKSRDLVHQLLAFSRKQTLEFSRFDLNLLIKEFSSLLRRTIAEDISIIYSLASGKLCIAGDRGQLEQVLMNLAVNAGDAMPGGGQLTFKTAAVRIDGISSDEHEHMLHGYYVEMTVSDTGIGMDREVCDQVFEPFYTTKSLSEGTGLGLATVYGIIKQHDGYIWVNSEKGLGTVFSIYLPLTAEEEGERSEADGTIPRSGAGEHILLVEDDDNVRKLAGEILVAAGYVVVPFSNGAAAVEFMGSSGKGIDLLLTDVVMPGMNGRQLYETLSEKDRDLRVLYMSGYPDDVIAGRGIEERALNFLQKPFSVNSLLSKVKTVLDS